MLEILMKGYRIRFRCIKKLKLEYLLVTLGENGMMLLNHNKKT